ncbi:hypothetical protein QBC38DRAFT_505537, partial [Podospora fimiseda]
MSQAAHGGQRGPGDQVLSQFKALAEAIKDSDRKAAAEISEQSRVSANMCMTAQPRDPGKGEDRNHEDDKEQDKGGEHEQAISEEVLASVLLAIEQVIWRAQRVSRVDVVGSAAINYISRREVDSDSNEKPFFTQSKRARQWSGIPNRGSPIILVRVPSGPSYFRGHSFSLPEASLSSDDYKENSRHDLMASAAIQQISPVSATFLTNHPSEAGGSKRIDLITLMELFWYTKATDRRDMFYGLVGLSAQDVLIDYSKQLSQIFLDVLEVCVASGLLNSQEETIQFASLLQESLGIKIHGNIAAYLFHRIPVYL